VGLLTLDGGGRREGHRRTAMAVSSGSHGGGTPVLPRRRGEAEDAQLVLAMLVAVAASPFGASLR
jgi:hypothetical protein